LNTKSGKVDIVISGASSGGISCALAALNRKYNIVLIDKGNIANALIPFPTNMVFLSTADQLELDGIPLVVMPIKSSPRITVNTVIKLLTTSSEKVSRGLKVTIKNLIIPRTRIN
jgi:thioredoxin reductase